jgi:hypothetical protein
MINQLLYHGKMQAKITALTGRSAFHCDEYLISWDGSSGIGIDKQRRCICLVDSNNQPSYYLGAEILGSEIKTESHQVTKRSHINMWGRYYLYKWLFDQHKANAAVLTGRVKTLTVIEEINLVVKVRDLNRPLIFIRILKNGNKQQNQEAMATAMNWDTYLSSI